MHSVLHTRSARSFTGYFHTICVPSLLRVRALGMHKSTVPAGDVVKAREIVQDPPDEDEEEEDEDEEEALHIRFELGRWVSEVNMAGEFLLEKLHPLEQEQLASTERKERAKAVRI